MVMLIPNRIANPLETPNSHYYIRYWITKAFRIQTGFRNSIQSVRSIDERVQRFLFHLQALGLYLVHLFTARHDARRILPVRQEA